MNTLSTNERKKEFIDSVKTGKKGKQEILENGITLDKAFALGYLDVSRAPLRGIKNQLNGTPTNVRNKCIEEVIIPFCFKNLLLSNNQNQFDEFHKQLCEQISKFYTENGYDDFILGKAQKWINMSLKYAFIYDEKDKQLLNKVFDYCHVPIDRYIANKIVTLNVCLPEYDGFKMPNLSIFNSDKHNYSWSKIVSYSEYINCQNSIRTTLNKTAPLEWEYQKWLEAKNERK